MTPRRDNVDQVVVAWLHEQASTSPVRYVDETLELLDRAPQRRWRGAVMRAIPVVAMPRAANVAPYLALVAMLLVALVAAAVMIGSQRRLPPPFGPAANGLISYDDGTNLYVSDPDGSRAVRIQGGLGFDDSGIFSPDGTLLAFVSSRQRGGAFPFVTNSDGTGTARQIGLGTLVENSYLPPTWSPDSTSIAYPAWVAKGPRGLFVASVETGDARYVAGDGAEVGFPAWSPDGRWIAYRSAINLRTSLMIVHPDGSGERELVIVAGDADAFTQIGWSPDSAAVVYQRPDGAAIFDLAHGERRITGSGRRAVTPTWSTDGSRIAFIEEWFEPSDEFVRDLVITTADGHDRRSLGDVVERLASWSPDSKFLIGYTAGDTPGRSSSELVIVPVEGGPVQKLTLPGNMYGTPSWQRVAQP